MRQDSTKATTSVNSSCLEASGLRHISRLSTETTPIQLKSRTKGHSGKTHISDQLERYWLATQSTSCRRAAATICPAQACKWWHDIRHVRIWIGHHYLCPCWTASTTNQSSLVTLTFDLLKLKVVSESRLTWATSVPVLVFLGFSVLDLSPMYATDRQTSDSIIA